MATVETHTETSQILIRQAEAELQERRPPAGVGERAGAPLPTR